MLVLSALLAFVQRIANGSFEPIVTTAAEWSNGRLEATG